VSMFCCLVLLRLYDVLFVFMSWMGLSSESWVIV